jgi:hypothetical protein
LGGADQISDGDAEMDGSRGTATPS